MSKGRIDSMHIGLVTIAYNATETLAQLLRSARTTRHELRIHLFLHSQHGPTVLLCEDAARSRDVQYYAYGVNRGVSASWNEGILDAYRAGADVVVIANDDVYFSDGDLARLAEKAVRCRERYIVTCAGYHLRLKRALPSHGYAVFAINPVALDAVGCFDENIFPAYCEDQDYARRARLSGLAEENCGETLVHHAGSGAIFADRVLLHQNGITHRQNLEYYWRKWGGDSGRERFERPFANAAFGQHIAPHHRHAPYGPGYDRTDRAIVRR
jgi:GT2 family glycosyltransferase